MDPTNASQALAEMTRVADVLVEVHRFFAAVDEVRGIFLQQSEPSYSGLRTKVEHARRQAEAVQEMLRNATT